jgi:Polynucleotide kinase 3 phosphatase
MSLSLLIGAQAILQRQRAANPCNRNSFVTLLPSTAAIYMQAGIENCYITQQQTRQRLDAVVAQVGVPCEVLLSLRDDNYRKPRIGCWELLVSSNETLQPVLSG